MSREGRQGTGREIEVFGLWCLHVEGGSTGYWKKVLEQLFLLITSHLVISEIYSCPGAGHKLERKFLKTLKKFPPAALGSHLQWQEEVRSSADQ